MLRVTEDGVEPATGAAGVRVMSMDLLLPSDDAPLRWRSPDAPDFLWQSTLEGGVLREFLADVRWGALDFLLIDAPPGTDKLTRLLQLLPQTSTLLLVTTPSEISRFVVAKSANVARQTAVRAQADTIGLVVNMAAHVCESCGHRTPLFDDDGHQSVTIDLPTWAEIPFDRRLALCTDRGSPFVLQHPDAPAARAIRHLAERLGGS
jgi:ATP-binding protein involved in chromosome partitioning